MADGIKMKIKSIDDYPDDTRLPTAHACNMLLELPRCVRISMCGVDVCVDKSDGHTPIRYPHVPAMAACPTLHGTKPTIREQPCGLAGARRQARAVVRVGGGCMLWCW